MQAKRGDHEERASRLPRQRGEPADWAAAWTVVEDAPTLPGVDRVRLEHASSTGS